jgi:hypothetical protein
MRKSWKTQRTTDDVLLTILEQHPEDPGSGEAPAGWTTLMPDNPVSVDLARLGELPAVLAGSAWLELELAGIMLSQQMLPNREDGCWLSWTWGRFDETVSAEIYG